MSEMWINPPRFSEEYSKGVKDFVGNAMKYVASLTEQIRDQIAKEMEEQVQKRVKLAEKNPGLNLDIELTSAAEPTVEPLQANNGSD
ncbi:hypothetical protein ACET3Z_001765 [Daucus carota]